ncbi:Ig-like domain repeat protein [Cellulomonas persica]|uniref:Bacterial Ig-like domain-containing protein n=1 Tax=Cellulomonas persica TaxID=76861 RepID=A0A510UWQ0_9CELL|nr:Ig-like domain repeat protein [Cellulomonas persica]GEK17931.1 hypothetical protein CPE01_16640 [Cellulomonas persica]
MASVAAAALVATTLAVAAAGPAAATGAQPLDVTVEPLAPSVTVSETDLRSDLTSTVTVEGHGFDPTLATGTRPPFSGLQSGLYIAFGRYPDVWRPSAGVPSTERHNPPGATGNGVSVIWAVPEASFAASSPRQDPSAPTYTILRADGSFTATVKVNRDWLADVSGNFGIYTYAGGGANVAAYETYTPVTFFERAESQVVASAVRGSVGKAVALPVAVDASGADVAGTVEATIAGTTVATGTLSAGRATLSLGGLTAGTHTVDLAFTPSTDRIAPSSSSVAVTVAKGAAKVAATWPSLTYGRTAKVAVTVSGPVAATGKVSLLNGSTVLSTATLSGGKASLTVPKTLAAGTRTLTVSYAGSSELSTAKVSSKRTVAKASSSITVKAATVTSKVAGKVVVTVKATGTTPTGKVTVKVTRNGTSYATKTVTLRSGTRTVTLPKLGKGMYNVKVTYAGSSNVKASSRSAQLKVV